MQSVKTERNVGTDRTLRAAIGLLVVVLVYVIYAGIHERVVVAGDTAPDFTITADNGRTVSLPKFGGRILVLNFWASWCPPCVEETPSLSQFAQAYAAKGVVVMGVSVDKDEKLYHAFLQRFHPGFLTVRDLKIHEDYGTFRYPETYIIDNQGNVLRKFAEAVDWTDPQITRYIDSLL
jgi:cytochrome c biogenesis protein CcmG/thiol:disulfide interchange protein DsbE